MAKSKPKASDSRARPKKARPTKVHTLPKAMPPPDDPLRRFVEQDTDLLTEVGVQPEAANSVLMAAMTSAATERGTRARAGTSAREESQLKKSAQFRLAALEHSRAMVFHAPGKPTPAALALTATGGSMPVAPIAGTSNWVQLGPTAIPNGQTYTSARALVTGRVTAVVVDPTNPQVLYVGAAQGGVWKSIDGGNHWVPTSDNEVSLAIGALAIDPGNPQILYAGTGEGNFSGDSYYGNGVLKTVNGGASWTALASTTFLGNRFSRLIVTPGATTRLFGATNNGIYRSTNSGVTWSLLGGGLPSFGQATDVAVDPSNSATVYAAYWGVGIYKTNNAAAANPIWTKLAGGLPNAAAAPPAGFSRIALGVSPTSPQTIYALLGSDNHRNRKSG
jgi:hypothetical protein